MRVVIFCLVLLLSFPFVSAEVVGSFDGLVADVDYSAMWKIEGTTFNQLFNEYTDWYTISIVQVTSDGCLIGVASGLSVNPTLLVPTFVEAGTIVEQDGLVFGVADVDLTPLRCEFAYDFDAYGSLTDGEDVGDTLVEDEADDVGDLPVGDETYPAQVVNCLETDNGDDPHNFGSVEVQLDDGSSLHYTDMCPEEHELVEFYCDYDRVLDGDPVPVGSRHSYYTCPGVCSHGECGVQCSESDGGFAPYSGGVMEHSFVHLSSPVADSCYSPYKLTEYYCNDALYADADPENDFHHSVWCNYGCITDTSTFDLDKGRCRTLTEAMNPWSTFQWILQWFVSWK